ncbi:MAG: glycoside hydrolase family 25 protein [Clostridium sp.]|nr:glycoside hydrolase family 25 protein [Clostridium sp.]MCM1547219.1 glycoside hydrolase family 25 protein [Ruminococcus sp.]
MKPKNRKIITALTALVMMLSCTLSVRAESLIDSTDSIDTTEGTTAILDYDPDTDTYALLDEEENIIPFDIPIPAEETQDPTEPEGKKIKRIAKVTAVTTIPDTEPAPTSRRKIVAKYGVTTTVTTTTTTTTTTTKPKTTAKKTTAKTTVKTTAKTTAKATTAVSYKGIDVSRWQGDINWTSVKNAGIKFVMIKAGYGKSNDQVDAKFKTNIAGAQKAGIDCGVYWYSYALNTADALMEAKACYNTIKSYKLSYPVAFDIEDSSQMGLTNTQLSNITKVFCDHLESLKYYVTVYSFSSMFTDRFNSTVKSNYDVWVAHINVSKPSYTGKYGMWQYSHTGKVNGISTAVDLDYSYKYYPDIIKKNKLNGY